jgi:hypothetical protein
LGQLAHLVKTPRNGALRDLRPWAHLLRGHGTAVRNFFPTYSGPALRLLATDLFAGHAEYDPVVDLLRPTNRTPAVPGGISPESFKRRPLSDIVPPRVLPKTTAKPQPARPRRPGWAD